MKVIFDHQAFALQRHGGVSRYFVELSLHLKKINVGVDILSILHKNQHLMMCSDQSLNRGIYLNCGMRFLERVSRLGNYIRSSAYGKYEIDIYHETYYIPNKLFHGKYKAKVTTVHDMIGEKFNNKKGVNIKKMAVQSSDHVICVSNNTKNDLMDLFNVNEDKITVIHLGINSIKPLYLPKSEFGKEKEPYILFVGKRDNYKNFESLLKAYSSNSQINNLVNLVCFGGGEFTKFEVLLLKSYGVYGKIRHVSGDDATLSLYYCKALLFVYPSLYEGFGIPPLEAMSNSCPVACSNTGSIPEVVGGAALYFNPYSVEEISTAIERLIFDNTLRMNLIVKGLERVELFNWQDTAIQTKSLYKKIIG